MLATTNAGPAWPAEPRGNSEGAAVGADPVANAGPALVVAGVPAAREEVGADPAVNAGPAWPAEPRGKPESATVGADPAVNAGPAWSVESRVDPEGAAAGADPAVVDGRRTDAGAGAAADPDRAAVDAARSGDAGAFESLVLRYQARIVNYASALVRDAGAAEDVAQETFVRAWRGLGRFRGESAFRTWLYRIAANVARTHLDRRGRQARIADGSLDDETEPLQADDVASEAPDAETSLVTREAIDRALAELPDELRLALVLRDVEGLDYKEIAGVTGAPMGTVESRIFRARRHMRTLLRPLRTARPPRRGIGNGRSGPRGEDR